MALSTHFRGLILCDIDETLINADYKLTVSRETLCAVLQQALEAGFAVGLNSDTAIQALVARAHEFGMNGPLIGERGALLARNTTDTPAYTVATGQHLENTMKKILAQFVNHLLARGDCSLVFDGVGNITPVLEKDTPTSLPIRVFINNERRCSVGFWIRDINGGKPKKNPDTSQRIVDEFIKATQMVGVDINSLDIDNNPDYGICIVHHPDTQKSVAVQALLNSSPTTTVYMIGNSISDLLNHPSIVQCAVGNAKDAYKAQCSIVAKHTLSEGVVEIIQRIIREPN